MRMCMLNNSTCGFLVMLAICLCIYFYPNILYNSLVHVFPAYTNSISNLSCYKNVYAGRYHSESGWQTLLEIIVEHYGFEVDQSVITIFVCLVPVIMDACVKLWVCSTYIFRILTCTRAISYGM